MRKTKPLSPYKARKIPGKPAEQPKPATVDGLIASIGEILGKVDALMEKRKDRLSWNYLQYGTPLWGFRQTGVTLIDQLSAALAPKGESAKQYGTAAVRAAWGTKPGEPCTWARPGSFLAHAGIIPVRCQWGGFLTDSKICAIDPKQRLWFSADWEIGFGPNRIDQKCTSPVSLFHELIASRLRPPTYKNSAPRQLFALGAQDMAEVAAWLADPANAWWAAELSRPPSNSIELPAGIRPVQQSLFG